MDRLATALLFLSCIATARADFLVLKSGQVIFGKLQSQTEERTKFERSAGTVTYPALSISHVFTNRGVLKNPDAEFLPDFGHIIDHLGQRKWVYDVQQIPATVVDKGVLKNIPYLSFRCSPDYEINIYGDPERPAAIEIGIYRSLLNKPDARERCVDFVSDLFADSNLGGAVKKLNRDRDLQTVGKWAVEVTPPERDDSYGGWWISIYSEQLVDSSRASPQELSQITVQKSQIREAQTDTTSWKREDLRYSRQAPVASPANTISTQTTYSAPTTAGSVYVRGYTRKDGTYVHPHTRKR